MTIGPSIVAAALTSALATVALAQAPPQGAQQGQPPPVRDVSVQGIPGVVAAGATWQRVWQGNDNADGLVGTPDGGVLFAQEQSSRVSKLDAAGTRSVFAENTHGAGALAIDARGRVIAVQRTCTDPGLRTPCAEPTAVAVIFPERERAVLADSVDGMPLGRLNDLVVGKSGTVYFTVGDAYVVAPGKPVQRIGQNLRTNGIMLSPDERTLYITNGATVVAFDVQPDGSVNRPRDFAHLDGGGSGDGLAVDAEGRLYVTSQPGVQVFAADGKYLGIIPTPRNAISVAFSGPSRRTLYIVGSGALDANGQEMTTAPGVRNNAKSIFAITLLAQGFIGRAK